VLCDNLEHLCVTTRWHGLDEVENVYVAYNISNFAIYLPKFVEIR